MFDFKPLLHPLKYHSNHFSKDSHSAPLCHPRRAGGGAIEHGTLHRQWFPGPMEIPPHEQRLLADRPDWQDGG